MQDATRIGLQAEQDQSLAAGMAWFKMNLNNPRTWQKLDRLGAILSNADEAELLRAMNSDPWFINAAVGLMQYSLGEFLLRSGTPEAGE